MSSHEGNTGDSQPSMIGGHVKVRLYQLMVKKSDDERPACSRTHVHLRSKGEWTICEPTPSPTPRHLKISWAY